MKDFTVPITEEFMEHAAGINALLSTRIFFFFFNKEKENFDYYYIITL